jgi:hypothetical protein
LLRESAQRQKERADWRRECRRPRSAQVHLGRTDPGRMHLVPTRRERIDRKESR